MSAEPLNSWVGASISIQAEAVPPTTSLSGYFRTRPHSFRGWAQICDWIVQNVFSLPPLLDDHQELTDRAVLPSLSLVRKLAIAIEKNKRLNEVLRASDLFNIAVEACIEVPHMPRGWELDVERGARAIGMVTARVFQERQSVTVDEYTITRIEIPPDELMHHPGKGYVFSKMVDQDVTQGSQDDPIISPQLPQP